jgi:hypothetical protein
MRDYKQLVFSWHFANKIQRALQALVGAGSPTVNYDTVWMGLLAVLDPQTVAMAGV